MFKIWLGPWVRVFGFWFLNMIISFSVFDPPPFQRQDLWELSRYCLGLLLPGTSSQIWFLSSCSSAAMVKRSKEACKAGHWVLAMGSEVNSCHKLPSSTSNSSDSSPHTAGKEAVQCLSLPGSLTAAEQISPRFITERQHLCLQSCFCRMSKVGRWWFLSLGPLCCLWHVQPSQLLPGTVHLAPGSCAYPTKLMENLGHFSLKLPALSHTQGLS